MDAIAKLHALSDEPISGIRLTTTQAAKLAELAGTSAVVMHIEQVCLSAKPTSAIYARFSEHPAERAYMITYDGHAIQANA